MTSDRAIPALALFFTLLCPLLFTYLSAQSGPDNRILVKVLKPNQKMTGKGKVMLHLPGQAGRELVFDQAKGGYLLDMTLLSFPFSIVVDHPKYYGSLFQYGYPDQVIQVLLHKRKAEPLFSDSPWVVYRERADLVEVDFNSEVLVDRKGALALVDKAGLSMTGYGNVARNDSKSSFFRYNDLTVNGMLQEPGIKEVYPVLEVLKTVGKKDRFGRGRIRYGSDKYYRPLSSKLLVYFSGDLEQEAEARRTWIIETEKKLPLLMTDNYLESIGRETTLRQLLKDKDGDREGSSRPSLLWFSNPMVLEIHSSIRGLVVMDLRNTLLADPNVSSVEFWYN